MCGLPEAQLGHNTPDQYPMPRVDESVDAIGCTKGKYFSSLDLMKGYHQVKMDEQSKCYLPPSVIPVSPHAFWINECPSHVLEVDGQVILRPGMGSSFHLFG